MKLYYSPGACSLSPHIVLREAGLAFDLEQVDLRSGRTAAGTDFKTINPLGYVPALALDDGAVLTEGAAIVQYLADLKPELALAPPAGTLARARLQEQLNFLASELHKAFSPLFNPTNPDAVKAAATTRVRRALDHLERQLGDGRAFLLGADYSVADAYLFVLAGWTSHTGIALADWPRLAALVGRVGERPAARQALAAEGLA